MNDERLRIAVPYLLMVVLGLMVIILPMWARTLGILGAVTGSCGLVWACWGGDILGKGFRRISRRRVRNASSEPHAETIDPIDEWIALAVPCEPEIYDEMTKAVAGGLRLAQVPGCSDDPRMTVDGPYGYRTTLEKPSEL